MCMYYDDEHNKESYAICLKKLVFQSPVPLIKYSDQNKTDETYYHYDGSSGPAAPTFSVAHTLKGQKSEKQSQDEWYAIQKTLKIRKY